MAELIKLGKDFNCVKFLQKAYDLSRDKEYVVYPLSDKDAEKIVITSTSKDAINFDYVHNRPVKLHIYIENGIPCIYDVWYDHTDAQLEELLASAGVNIKIKNEHIADCLCEDCKVKK